MKLIPVIILFFVYQYSGARIVNRKVKEAPKTCAVMAEDDFLTRKEKRVLGTLRHSVLIDEDDESITLVKDKGEKICQWSFNQWAGIQANNKLPDLKNFKFYIDEYKNVIYPYVQKTDKSYFLMNIPITSCDLNDQITRTSLELPACEVTKIAKKIAKRSFSRKKSRKIASNGR